MTKIPHALVQSKDFLHITKDLHSAKDLHYFTFSFRGTKKLRFSTVIYFQSNDTLTLN